MTKTKAQLRAEAVERLKMIPPMSVHPRMLIDAICGHQTAWKTVQDVSNELIDLLTDDCDQPCYTCSRLAELIAENGALKAENAKLMVRHREDQDAVAEITKKYWLLDGKLKDAQRENEKLSDREFYLRCCVVDMEGNVVS